MRSDDTMHLDWYDRGILNFVLDWAPRPAPPDDAAVARFGIGAPRVMRRFDAVVDLYASTGIPLEASDRDLVCQAMRYRSSAHLAV